MKLFHYIGFGCWLLFGFYINSMNLPLLHSVSILLFGAIISLIIRTVGDHIIEHFKDSSEQAESRSSDCSGLNFITNPEYALKTQEKMDRIQRWMHYKGCDKCFYRFHGKDMEPCATGFFQICDSGSCSFQKPLSKRQRFEDKIGITKLKVKRQILSIKTRES